MKNYVTVFPKEEPKKVFEEDEEGKENSRLFGYEDLYSDLQNLRIDSYQYKAVY